jgi:uncharacterized protein (TIGR00730 family)
MRIGIFSSSRDISVELYGNEIKKVMNIICDFSKKKPIHIMYGGGNKGLMGVVKETSVELSIPITGHNLKKWCVDPKDIIYPNLLERQQGIVKNSDVYIAFPGGVGTVYEMVQIMAHNDVERIEKPILIYNVDNFFTTFIDFIDEMKGSGFIDFHMNVSVASTPEEVYEWLYKLVI